MKHYPSYTFDMVLKEFTCRFFVLLDCAIKFDAMEKLELITIISVPHMKEADGQGVIDAYKRQFGQDTVAIDKERIKKDRERLLQKLRSKVL